MCGMHALATTEIADLPRDADALIAIILEQRRQYSAVLESMRQQLSKLKQITFGSRSERLSGQALLFGSSSIGYGKTAEEACSQGCDALDKNDFDLALKCYTEAIRLKPDYADAYYNRGVVYQRKGEYDKAIKALTANFKPAGISYYWLGAAYAAKGDRSNALDTMQKAFQSGFADFGAIDNNPYFSSLKSDPHFQQLILKYKK